ncbi:hypothetical protein SESBI_02704 [Sesbania bispinosa]|nr:hypothetical protein SESBI_02704 [Sesbania bispinosa]
MVALFIGSGGTLARKGGATDAGLYGVHGRLEGPGDSRTLATSWPQWRKERWKVVYERWTGGATVMAQGGGTSENVEV